MTCKKVSRYTFSEAQKALHTQKNRIVFTTLGLYYCDRHRCYHLGHSNVNEKVIQTPTLITLKEAINDVFRV